jgi:hypothetical protein
MNRATFSSLTSAEQRLVLETEPPRLLELDEDELLDLHDRVRRARKKHLGLDRRAGSARVGAKGARGKAGLGGPSRDAQKAEVFEDALARVSSRIAKVAREHAKALKAERLAAARGESAPGTPKARGSKVASDTSSTRARRPAPIDKKVASHTKASGKRRQAARDAR